MQRDYRASDVDVHVSRIALLAQQSFARLQQPATIACNGDWHRVEYFRI
jgi:hypothetical protein